MKYTRITCLILLCFCLNACQFFQPKATIEKGKVIAHVYDKYLYEKDLPLLNFASKNEADSIAKALQFTNNWMKENAVLYHAKEQLKEEDLKALNKQVDDYRNSLLMYAYERALTAQKMDTTIKNTDLSDYYNNYQANFKANTDLVKIKYFVIENTCVELEEIKKLFKEIDSDEEAMQKLQDLSFKYNALHSFTPQWFTFQDFVKKLDIKTTRNAADFLANNKRLQQADSLKTCLVSIEKYTLAGKQMEMDYCQNDIKAILLNKRQKEFWQRAKDNIYKDAQKSNDIQIYIK